MKAQMYIMDVDESSHLEELGDLIFPEDNETNIPCGFVCNINPVVLTMFHSIEMPEEGILVEETTSDEDMQKLVFSMPNADLLSLYWMMHKGPNWCKSAGFDDETISHFMDMHTFLLESPIGTYLE